MTYVANYLGPAEAPSREQIDGRVGPVLVEFGTGWCGHCSAAASQVKELLGRHPEVAHVKVEDGSGRALGRSFRVTLWPTFVLMRDGAVVDRLVRPGRAALAEAFENFVAGGGSASA